MERVIILRWYFIDHLGGQDLSATKAEAQRKRHKYIKYGYKAGPVRKLRPPQKLKIGVTKGGMLKLDTRG